MTEFQKEFHMTFKVSLAQLAAMVVQIAAIVWFAATLTQKVDTQAMQIADNKAQTALLANSQVQLAKDVAEIKGTLNYQKDVLENINNAVISKKR